VKIIKGKFYINGEPTYKGVFWYGHEIEGMLMNSRMVQAAFDDYNPETAGNWIYPDTGKWDPERNTSEYVAAMSSWRENGLLAITVGLQGGCPKDKFGDTQSWHVSAFNQDGSLDEAYMGRVKRVCDEADRLGMVVILSYFYFGQEYRWLGEGTIKTAAAAATDWIIDNGYKNILVETVNETDNTPYSIPLLKSGRAVELFDIVRRVSADRDFPLYVSASFVVDIPTPEVLTQADYILIHGNNGGPDWVEDMIKRIKGSASYRGQPIVNNEDPYYDFEKKDNNMLRSIKNGCSWGLLDIGENNYFDGYQRPPVNWGINTERKKQFFTLVRSITNTK